MTFLPSTEVYQTEERLVRANRARAVPNQLTRLLARLRVRIRSRRGGSTKGLIHYYLNGEGELDL